MFKLGKPAAQLARLNRASRVDQTRSINFTFDGKPYTGYAGDTLASALLANGVHLVGRSFKYHRPMIFERSPDKMHPICQQR